MMKKIFAILLVSVLAIYMPGCSCNCKSSSTTTTTTTDANGNTVTTIDSKTNENGNITEKHEVITSSSEKTCEQLAADGAAHTLPFKLINRQDKPITAVAITVSGKTADARKETIDGGLSNGEYIEGTFTYTKDDLNFDFIVFFEGIDEPITFSGITVRDIPANTEVLKLKVFEENGSLYMGRE